MRQILFAITFLIPFVSVGQKSLIRYNAIKQTIGFNYATDQGITVSGHTFPGHIKGYSIDKLGLDFIVTSEKELRDDIAPLANRFICFDFDSCQDLWHTIPFYGEHVSFELNDDNIIVWDGEKCHTYNTKTNKKQWKINSPILYYDTITNTGISYIFETYTNSITAIKNVDLETGKTIWRKNVGVEKLMEKFAIHNDTLLFAFNTTLYGLDINSGQGWDMNLYCDLKIMKDWSYSMEDVLVSAIGLVSGYFTGYFLISLGSIEAGYIYNTTSNILIDDNEFYYATEKEFFCSNYSGIRKWKKQLPKDTTGHTEIFLRDSIAYLTNMAYASIANLNISYGQPYLASYNKNTGVEYYFKHLADYGDYILDMRIYEDEILILLKNSIKLVSLIDGEIIKEYYVPVNSENTFTGFNEFEYYKIQSVKPLQITRPNILGSIELIDNSGNIYLFDHNLKLIEDESLVKSIFPSCNIGPYYIFEYESSIFAIDIRTEETICEIYNSTNPLLTKDFLYFTQDDTLFKLELDDIFTN